MLHKEIITGGMAVFNFALAIGNASVFFYLGRLDMRCRPKTSLEKCSTIEYNTRVKLREMDLLKYITDIRWGRKSKLIKNRISQIHLWLMMS